MYSKTLHNKKMSELIKEKMNEPKIDKYATSVWVDFNRLNESIEQKAYSEIEIEKGKNSDLSQKSLMYLKSSMDKDERVFKLKNAIDSEKIKTVQEASELLEVEVGTVVNYLKEIDKTLYDEQKDQIVGNTDEYKLSESKQLGRQSTKGYHPTFKYYNGDPEKGAKEITKDEHLKRIHQFKQKRIDMLEGKI